MPDRIKAILSKAVELGCSDIHLTVGMPPMVRSDGQMQPLEGYSPLNGQDTRTLCYSLLSGEQADKLACAGEADFSYSMPGAGRFRINVFRQRGSIAAAIRSIPTEIPTIDQLGLPPVLKELALRQSGIILVTGPTGSGKSTTLAAMINHINNNRKGHILTLEDPIEYLHKHNKCIVNQREIGEDSRDFPSALRAALREDPDILLVGEMRDLETMTTAIAAAETGHLVLSTLHTVSAAQSIDRIISMFPPYQENQIKMQLSGVLQGIVSQQLLPLMGTRGRVAAVELLLFTDAVRNLVREGKTHQISSMMQTGVTQGMLTMDYSLAQLVKDKKITLQEATMRSVDREMLKRYVY